jgi:BirA family transcriptional regulator, biotin operon repressor / biotin---[acetyl-CoA-carboxylase] ligase
MDQIIGRLIVRMDAVDSTNNYAKQLLGQQKVSEGTVFLTYEQTAGRGQVANIWESEAEQNLTFSIVFFPDFLEIQSQFMLSKVITLGVSKVLGKYIDLLKVKWPNDIYAGDKKLGGILIENSVMNDRLMYAVAGIGLNVNQTVFRSNAPNPVSLKMLTNLHYDCDQILSEILSGIDFYYDLLKNKHFETIDNEYISSLYRLRQRCLYRAANECFEGEIIGVNEIGQLVIKDSAGHLREFHFKEVKFLFE